jgi:hypothetical protein
MWESIDDMENEIKNLKAVENKARMGSISAAKRMQSIGHRGSLSSNDIHLESK